MWKTEQKVRDYVNKYHMIMEHEKIVAGVSGGADSVCLLLLLKKLQESMDFHIVVVHVNHNLRGSAADEDQKYVEKLCCEMKVPFFAVSEDVGKIAKEKGISLEEAGRNIRYQAFEKVCMETGADKIALAHHQDDQAETMIHHLARGTGLRGLCALKPVSGNRIRPLLCLTREDVETYLEKAGRTWRTDMTNFDDDYTRNKIRHHVIDYLTHNINPKAAAHMAQTAEELGEIEEFLESVEKDKKRIYVIEKKDSSMLLNGLAEEAPIVCRRIFLDEIKRIGGKSKDFTRTHSEDIMSLWKKQEGKKIMLPYGIEAERTREGIRLLSEEGKKNEQKKTKNLMETKPKIYKIVVPGDTVIGDYTVCSRISEWDFSKIEEKKYTKWLDYDKISDSLEIRSRMRGDKISVHPSKGSKKLKDYFIDAKIPREERGVIPLLADGSDIIWVIGHRLSEKYKITEHTKKVIQVQIKGGNIHE